jgi:hypothetical protein
MQAALFSDYDPSQDLSMQILNIEMAEKILSDLATFNSLAANADSPSTLLIQKLLNGSQGFQEAIQKIKDKFETLREQKSIAENVLF